jgi:2'-5' RNA ligase
VTPAEEPGHEEKALRLFVAVDVPERVRDAVDRALQRWRERFPDARWVPPENRHITVKFVGRTPPPLLDTVRGACAATARSIRPFRIRVEGMGVFPNPGRARVLWVGLRDKEGGLAAIAAALDRGLERDFPPDRRSFAAHLTVARFNPPRPVREQADDLKVTEIGADPFRVGSLVLYRSHLSPKGARYEPLDRFALRG